MTVESRLTDVEESLRLLRDANRLQSRSLSAAAPNDNELLGWNATTKKWEPKSSITTDTITERTPGAGVTVDGLLIKDGWPDPVVIKLLGEVFN